MTLTYSFVIPAYNESVRIRPTLHALLRYTQEQNWESEILVVNDGSTDDTAEIVREYNRAHPQVLLVENPGNRGKGYSVRNGMLHARGDICLFTDADLSSPMTEAQKLFEAIAQGADIAIGSRWLRVELQTERQPLYRQAFGRIFNLALRVILGLRFVDTQCGFKAFRRDAAQRIFPLQRIERWGFDPEISVSGATRWLAGGRSSRGVGAQRRNPTAPFPRRNAHVWGGSADPVERYHGRVRGGRAAFSGEPVASPECFCAKLSGRSCAPCGDRSPAFTSATGLRSFVVPLVSQTPRSGRPFPRWRRFAPRACQIAGAKASHQN